jgi:hypothetical protein
VDLIALAQDGAGAEEPDARDDLGRDPRRVCGTPEDLEAQP